MSKAPDKGRANPHKTRRKSFVKEEAVADPVEALEVLRIALLAATRYQDRRPATMLATMRKEAERVLRELKVDTRQGRPNEPAAARLAWETLAAVEALRASIKTGANRQLIAQAMGAGAAFERMRTAYAFGDNVALARATRKARSKGGKARAKQARITRRARDPDEIEVHVLETAYRLDPKFEKPRGLARRIVQFCGWSDNDAMRRMVARILLNRTR